MESITEMLAEDSRGFSVKFMSAIEQVAQDGVALQLPMVVLDHVAINQINLGFIINITRKSAGSDWAMTDNSVEMFKLNTVSTLHDTPNPHRKIETTAWMIFIRCKDPVANYSIYNSLNQLKSHKSTISAYVFDINGSLFPNRSYSFTPISLENLQVPINTRIQPIMIEHTIQAFKRDRPWRRHKDKVVSGYPVKKSRDLYLPPYFIKHTPQSQLSYASILPNSITTDETLVGDIGTSSVSPSHEHLSSCLFEEMNPRGFKSSQEALTYDELSSLSIKKSLKQKKSITLESTEKTTEIIKTFSTLGERFKELENQRQEANLTLALPSDVLLERTSVFSRSKPLRDLLPENKTSMTNTNIRETEQTKIEEEMVRIYKRPRKPSQVQEATSHVSKIARKDLTNKENQLRKETENKQDQETTSEVSKSLSFDTNTRTSTRDKPNQECQNEQHIATTVLTGKTTKNHEYDLVHEFPGEIEQKIKENQDSLEEIKVYALRHATNADNRKGNAANDKQQSSTAKTFDKKGFNTNFLLVKLYFYN